MGWEGMFGEERIGRGSYVVRFMLMGRRRSRSRRRNGKGEDGLAVRFAGVYLVPFPSLGGWH
jgi:hypothetical protein